VASTSSFSRARWISSGRVALALAGLVIAAVSPDRAILAFLLGAFLAFALALAVRGGRHSGMLGLLALFVDTVFFLVQASYGFHALLAWLLALWFLFLMVEALTFWGPLEVAVVALVAGGFCAILPNDTVRPVRPAVLTAGALAFGVAVDRRRKENANRATAQELEAARKRADRVREDERQRIASDFHDGPLQSFISLQMRLEILRKLLERDYNAGIEDLKQLQALAQSQVRDLRAFLHSMRPVDVDGANLVGAARRTAESFQKESGIPVTFLGTNAPVGLPPEMTTEVLQMLREALHNVQKHAGATRVAVALEKTERGLEISVDDNGHGFNFAGSYSLEELELLRLGPASLKRRARSLNADLMIESRPGRGAGIKFRVPLQ
jgi:signal transduction histidine kinase